MKISNLILKGLWILGAQAWSHEWDSEYETKWQGQNSQKFINADCKVSRMGAFDMSKTKDPIFMSSNGEDHPISPKLVPLNSTAGEQVC
jgi:hypothetical protein